MTTLRDRVEASMLTVAALTVAASVLTPAAPTRAVDIEDAPLCPAVAPHRALPPTPVERQARAGVPTATPAVVSGQACRLSP